MRRPRYVHGRPGPRSALAGSVFGPHDRIIRVIFPAAGVLIGVMMLAFGAWKVRQAGVDGRNVAGNPAMERLVGRCTLPGTRTTIRLYRGEGGATVAFWYSVTRERPGAPERQFWYSYAEPAVTGITCRPNGVVALHLDERGPLHQETYTADRIERDLVRRPLLYWRGSPERVLRDTVNARGGPLYARFDRGVGLRTTIIGAVIALASTLALARLRRRAPG